jgi:two-component system chemotaxis sensor kinase CheA
VRVGNYHERKDKDLERLAESQDISRISGKFILGRDRSVSDELINKVFELFKGGFGFFGLEHIKELSHTMENVLDLVRNRKISVTELMIDSLFKGIDKLKTLLQDVENSDSTPIDEECALFTPFLSDKPIEQKATVKSPEATSGLKKVAAVGSLKAEQVIELVARKESIGS